MRPPIQSVKHIQQNSLFSVPEGTALSLTAANAQDVRGTANSSVLQGSVIKAIFIEYWILGEGNQPSSMVLNVQKKTGSEPEMTFSEMLNVGQYPGKKNVLFMSQGLVGDANTNPTPFIRQWIKIPKGKQRFGLGDQIRINFAAIDPTAGAGLEVCGLVIYKEYN